MTPELRDYVLSLPLDVRRELDLCQGPKWFCSTLGRYGITTDETPRRPGLEVADNADERTAYLPVSPIAIALHAAKLSGMDRGEMLVSERSGHSRCAVSSPVDPYSDAGDICAFGGGMEENRDPTGHRAAIALLMKVM